MNTLNYYVEHYLTVVLALLGGLAVTVASFFGVALTESTDVEKLAYVALVAAISGFVGFVWYVVKGLISPYIELRRRRILEESEEDED